MAKNEGLTDFLSENFDSSSYRYRIQYEDAIGGVKNGWAGALVWAWNLIEAQRDILLEEDMAAVRQALKSIQRDLEHELDGKIKEREEDRRLRS